MTSRLPDELCRWTRWQLCRLAVGRSLGDEARDLARHVRGCRDCDDFVDDLAALRAFLTAADPPEPSSAEVVRQARRALAGELGARLARDLLLAARDDPPRPAADRRRDLRRLAVLTEETGLDGEARAELEELLGGPAWPAPIERRRLLALAARLDPLGLDVALAWMGHLVRSGRDTQAQRVADRVLSGWNPWGGEVPEAGL